MEKPSHGMPAATVIDVVRIPVARWSNSVAVPDHYCVSTVTAPMQQGSCGACWAIASASCFCDRARLPLTEAGYKDVAVNTRHQVRYGWLTGGNTQCDGGFVAAGLMCIQDVGYLAAMQQRHRCTFVYRVNLYDTFGVVNKMYVDCPPLTAAQLRLNSLNIAREIYMLGTVCATFNLFSDFMDFWNTEGEDAVYRLGMYSRHAHGGTHGTQGSKSWTPTRPGPGGNIFVVNHSVAIIGFDHDSWLCRSSWGAPSNRPRGLFRIARGVNMCGIESDVMACTVVPHSLAEQSAWSAVTLVPIEPTSVVSARDVVAALLVVALVVIAGAALKGRRVRLTS